MRTPSQEAGARRVHPFGRPYYGAPCGMDAPEGMWERWERCGTAAIERLFQTQKHNIIQPESGPTVGVHFRDSNQKSYCLVEFEDAAIDSIFKKKERSTSEWADRFEHGFGQLVDWFWKIDDVRPASQSRAIFGTDALSFMGMLVVGRDSFLSEEELTRLKWRINKVTINSNQVVCLTFDQLAKGLRDALTLYSSIGAAN